MLNYRDTPKGAKDNPDSVWSEANKKAFLDAIKGGKGLYVHHYSSGAFTNPSDLNKEFEKAIAGGWRKQGFHGKMHVFTVTVRKEHPITEGIKEFEHGRDELYQNSLMLPGSEVLVTAYSEKAKDPKNTGKHEPVVWVAKYGKGRVVENVLGHDLEAMKDPGFQTLLVRGVEWAATGKATFPPRRRRRASDRLTRPRGDEKMIRPACLLLSSALLAAGSLLPTTSRRTSRRRPRRAWGSRR